MTVSSKLQQVTVSGQEFKRGAQVKEQRMHEQKSQMSSSQLFTATQLLRGLIQGYTDAA